MNENQDDNMGEIPLIVIPNNPQQVLNQLDHRGFNLLFIAAEDGNNAEVLRLINIGFDVNSTFGAVTAANLAYQNLHYDTLLILLQANSKFPFNFDANSTQHADLIAFDALMRAFHEHLFGEEIENLQNIINAHPNLRYFYNTSGASASCEALSNMMYSSYEVLVRNKILLSPGEDFEEIMEQFEREQKEEIKKIHDRYAVALPNNHLMIINGSLFVGYDIGDDERIDRLNFAQTVMEFLDAIPHIKPILKLIARAGCFKIIFDFNRENTRFINPTTSRDTRGLFCSTRHIYIAARNLFDDTQKFQVYGTISHELCHFAMDLVYGNDSKPYKKVDNTTIGREFHQILHQCRELRGIDDIIDFVWHYEESQQFAELIVRVPHMTAFYANNQVILNQRRATFQSLFNFYETRVLPDVENKIPTINAEMNQRRADFFDKTFKKVSRWRKAAKIAFVLVPIGIIIATILTFFTIFMPELKFFELSPNDQAKVFNGNVKFMNMSLKFHNLYNDTNFQLLSSLDSIRLRTLMKGDTLDLSDTQNNGLRSEIFLVYANMTESLREKLREESVNFQGEIVTIKLLIGDGENSEIFHALSASQVRELFIGTLKLGKVQEIKTKFYFERKFVESDSIEPKKYKCIDKQPENSISFTQISSIANETKMFLLSDHAGAGKTTTFKHISIKLKEKYPNYWIAYVDLKRYLKVYEKNEENFQISQVLLEILSMSDGFEVQIFTKLFNDNKVILLFDGVDEISPKFKVFFMKFVEMIRNSTNNQQWIATRPQHIEDMISKFNQKAYKLQPFDDDIERKDFIENVMKNLGETNFNIIDVVDAIDKPISRCFVNTYNPLMIQLLTELYVKNRTILKEVNLFTILDTMIDMKKKILFGKGENVDEDRDNRKAKMTIWQVLQIYALKLLYKNGFKDYVLKKKTINIDEFKLLERWNKTEKSKWTPEAISRYGFLIVDNWNTKQEFPDFSHRLYADFFAAQFAIQDLYELHVNDDDEMTPKEIVMRINLLIRTVKIASNEEAYIRNFVVNFAITHKSKIMHKEIYKIITSDQMMEFIKSQDNFYNEANYYTSITDVLFIEIFSLDVRFLKKIRFNEMTVFQDYFLRDFNYKIDRCINFLRIVNAYEKSLGADWIHHTGYSLRESNQLPSDEEINEFLKHDSNSPIQFIGTLFNDVDCHLMMSFVSLIKR